MDKAPDAFRTISEVADELDLPQHVLRFWETRFNQIRPMKRGGGRRYYRPDDVELLRGIRHLLYGEGYTIRGVQRILREHGAKFVQSVWEAGAAQPSQQPADEEDEVADSEAAAEVSDMQPPRQGSGDSTRDTPAARRQREPRLDAASDQAAASFGRDDVRKLQAALHELGECRRLLDVALQGDS